ncbi:hypothetical protein SODALDRAFT_69869 [Sodiomyces alkalinus F11]|uniref:Calcineurin-like phosphoesterase domain-containing protein n=1 Tax=Sodiomyces alkalinus (strain CBS 110278 / VKM F-3762 / F11) TaxID=1314773 RepID=A0A3N2PM13_SODAK|nr:hypothetical protein SODALDRAFT_69869 [Sodiomyces alkalinus F11]ROT35567.1 hypothetical protein SODALDRAFT_69869 [Sodiomyces alkalinus F11]
MTPNSPASASASSPSSAKPFQPVQTLRRTRFVLISDTHRCTPALPRGDVLIHAGDLTNQGSFSELSRAIQWLEKTDFEAKIVVADLRHELPKSLMPFWGIDMPGNHDLALDRELDRGNGPSDSSADDCISLMTSSPSITYLTHAAAQIRLTSPKGPRTTFRVFGSPYSPRNAHHGIFAAFTYPPALPTAQPQPQPQPQPPESLPTLWDDIPLDTDVVVTHTPPRTHCDHQIKDGLPAGCEALRRALWRVRPRLAVCGHIHQARGAERVLWELGCGHVAFQEAGVRRWADPDPAGRKMSLVDLTARDRDPLRNDGSHRHTTGPKSASVPLAESAEVKGFGGEPASHRSDQTALLGRRGRQETCVVNCAIMAKSYPHVGGRTMNKPIVVDLDLPTWDL